MFQDFRALLQWSGGVDLRGSLAMLGMELLRASMQGMLSWPVLIVLLCVTGYVCLPLKHGNYFSYVKSIDRSFSTSASPSPYTD